jgi:hypothetical protein
LGRKQCLEVVGNVAAKVSQGKAGGIIVDACNISESKRCWNVLVLSDRYLQWTHNYRRRKWYYLMQLWDVTTLLLRNIIDLELWACHELSAIVHSDRIKMVILLMCQDSDLAWVRDPQLFSANLAVVPSFLDQYRWITISSNTLPNGNYRYFLSVPHVTLRIYMGQSVLFNLILWESHP